MEKILKRGKCVECKKPTGKKTLKWNGGTCDPCTDKEMAETEKELAVLTGEKRAVLIQRGEL